MIFGSIPWISARTVSSSPTVTSRSSSVSVRLPSTLVFCSFSTSSWFCNSATMVSDLPIRSCSLSSMFAVRIRSWRSASARCFENTPTKLSQPVFERISSKSLENPAVTSSSPMISSAMLAFIRSVWACTSSSVAFSMSMAISSPDIAFAARGFDPAGQLGDLRLRLGHLGLAFLDLGVEIGGHGSPRKVKGCNIELGRD